MSADGMSDIVEHVSAVPSDATLGRLTAAIARDGGLVMPPATVLPLATRHNPVLQILLDAVRP